MKATILNGSPRDNTAMADIHSIINDELKANGWEVESFKLNELKINHCVGCFHCWVKTPGECRFKDDAPEIARQFVQNDLSIFLTPITFGGYSSQLKKALDRIICVISPFFMILNNEMHHKPRYDKYPNVLGLGVMPRQDKQSEQIFSKLIERNALNMHTPIHHAEVLISDQGPEIIKQQVQTSLNKVGVSK